MKAFVLEHGEAKEDQAFQTYTSWLAGQTAQTVLKIARATGSKAAGGAGNGGGQTMVADALGGIGTSLEACSTKIAEASIERAVSKERTAKVSRWSPVPTAPGKATFLMGCCSA